MLKNCKFLSCYPPADTRPPTDIRVGDDKALFDAARIDATIIGCPSIAAQRPGKKSLKTPGGREANNGAACAVAVRGWKGGEHPENPHCAVAVR